MKKLFAFLLFVFVISAASAQEEKIDCCEQFLKFVTLIDNKLPPYISGEASFFNDTIQHVILFKIRYGKIKILTQDLSILDSISDTTMFKIDIFFEEPNGPYSYKKHFYSFNDRLYFLRTITVIVITNFNVKKGIYYIQRIGNGEWISVPKWKRKYGNYSKFLKRIYSGVYPRFISKVGEDKPYPVY